LPLDLRQLRRHAREYVELEAHARVTGVRFAKRFTLFGREDVALSVEIDDPSDPSWWVIGGSTPMNLYSKKAFPEVGMAFSLHTGLMMQLLDRQFKESRTPPKQIGYDAFISHASEDRQAVVKPLARELARLGLRVWYDEFELKVGDSLRQSIDRGLATSQFGIVVLSHAFFAKNWPQYELNGLVAREVRHQSAILPIWHNVTREDVLEYSPNLADRVAVSTGRLSIRKIATALADAMEEH
jgi:hypothetical protein